MSLFVNTNMSAINAQRQLINSGNSLSQAFQRLSSGFRINSAADDAAGLQISNRLTSAIQGQEMAIRNANDAISVTGVAEGALDESVNLMQRMRTLAVQANNGINSQEDRVALNKEFQSLRLEIDRIASTTQFGGVNLLSASFEGHFLIGANAGNDFVISDLNGQSKNLGEVEWNARTPAAPGGYDAINIQLATQPITLNGVTFNQNYARAEDFVRDINSTKFPYNQGPVTAELQPFTLTSGIDLSVLPAYMDLNGVTVDLTTGIDLTDWDPALPTAENASLMSTVVSRINAVAAAQGLGFSVSGVISTDPANNMISMNSLQGNSLPLDNGAPATLPTSSTLSLNALLPALSATTYMGAIDLYSAGEKFSNIDMQGSTLNNIGFFADDIIKHTVDTLDLFNAENAERALNILDIGLRQVGAQRSELGAQANSLHSAVRSLSITNENTSAARSRIRDTDFAKETAELTRTQILQQAGTTILSQANQRPQAALSLLG